MRITTARRISQIFFFFLFVWLCLVSTLGERFWQLRGWPVNWLLQLDPLVGLGTLIATGSLYAGLLWGLLTLILTILLGRVFCGWICPFGALHQAVGWLANRKHKAATRMAANRYRPAQRLKYILLVFLLGAAGGGLVRTLLDLSVESTIAVVVIAAVSLLCAITALWVRHATWRDRTLNLVMFIIGWVIAGFLTDGSRLLAASLQTGLLDPIPLFYRSINLTLLPLADGPSIPLAASGRLYPGSLAMGLLFWAAVLLNLYIPRFYCRFVCPLGALFGVVGRNAIYRMGQKAEGCTACGACNQVCEGACAPAATIRTAECLLCLNCLDACRHGVMGYRHQPSAAGEINGPDLSKREFTATLVAGLAAVPLARLAGGTGGNWNPAVIRPPGALSEEMFLQRCIKCGQCMRVCPTNVIHPAALQAGIEGIWTPILNFRMGTSGCQRGCIACGNLCPTAAIRPISLDERLGRGDFVEQGPIRIGTAFVDRGRCLPWAMDRPCIVCQENCPVSPKAIVTQETFHPVRLDGALHLIDMVDRRLRFDGPALPAERFATGDYFVTLANDNAVPPARIVDIGAGGITLAENPFASSVRPGDRITVQVRLQLPVVNLAACIGCGVCEHECPVKGRRAIRVSAENETRDRRHRLSL